MQLGRSMIATAIAALSDSSAPQVRVAGGSMHSVATESMMGTDLFVYGSLQLPSVMAAVTGRRFPAVPALLSDHARYSLLGRRYPGLRPHRGQATDGVLYRNVDRLSLARLDAFEDDFYRRVSVTVIVGRDRAVPAEVYLVAPANYRRLEWRRWDLTRFQRCFLKPFLRRCRRGFAAASCPADPEATQGRRRRR